MDESELFPTFDARSQVVIAMVYALIASHPDRPSLLGRFDAYARLGLEALQAQTVTDAEIDAARKLARAMRRLVDESAPLPAWLAS